MINDDVLDELAKTNPELVARYRAQKQSGDAEVKSARDMQDYGSIANVVGKNLTDLGNAKQSGVVLYNRMSDLGRAPDVRAPQQQAYDGSVIADATSRGVARAKDDQQQGQERFWEAEKVRDRGQSLADAGKARDKAARSADPKSAESGSAREFLKSRIPDSASIPNFENLSEEQIAKVSPALWDKYKLDQESTLKREEMSQRSADRAADSANRSADRAAMVAGRRDDRADEVARKDADYQASVKIPGMAVQPGYRPTAEAAKTVRSAKSAHDELTGALGQLDTLYKRSGTNYVGDDSNTQAALVSGMQAKLKDLESLGALSASDYALLSKQLPDPTSAAENVKGMFGGDSYAARSKAFRDQLERSLQSTATNNGYQATGDAKPTAGGVHGKDLP